MSEMQRDDAAADSSRGGARRWRWLWAVVVVAVLVGFFFGWLGAALLGVGLLGGGLWARREAQDPRDRTIAGGLAGAGAAILVVTVVLLSFLTPVSVSDGQGPVDEDRIDVEDRSTV